MNSPLEGREVRLRGLRNAPPARDSPRPPSRRLVILREAPREPLPAPQTVAPTEGSCRPDRGDSPRPPSRRLVILREAPREPLPAPQTVAPTEGSCRPDRGAGVLSPTRLPVGTVDPSVAREPLRGSRIARALPQENMALRVCTQQQFNLPQVFLGGGEVRAGRRSLVLVRVAQAVQPSATARPPSDSPTGTPSASGGYATGPRGRAS
jgi:hypothetical protein